MLRQAMLFAISATSFHLLTLLMCFWTLGTKPSLPAILTHSLPHLSFHSPPTQSREKWLESSRENRTHAKNFQQQVQLPPNYQECNKSSGLPQPDRDFFFLSSLAGDNYPIFRNVWRPIQGVDDLHSWKTLAFQRLWATTLCIWRNMAITSSMETLSASLPFRLHKFGF